jgi:hypothetical protein
MSCALLIQGNIKLVYIRRVFFVIVAGIMGQRLEHLVRFYSILDSLQHKIGGSRKLADCSGRMAWPRRGVYFFHEQAENRSDTGNGPRIVRVGTHALTAGSGTKLWTRLSQHKGALKTGGGNHRGSIFRLIVGAALVNREKLDFATWGDGQTADRDVRTGELALERQVSQAIGNMRVLWLAIEDEPGPESGRGYIERNSIALLSNFNKPALDPPSPDWLGHHSDRERVRKSGLWNQNHVEEACDPAFLDTLDRLVSDVSRVA